jgi:hypothetical protein
MTRYAFGANQREYGRITTSVSDTTNNAFKSGLYFGVIGMNGVLNNGASIRTSSVSTTQTPYFNLENAIQNRRIVLFDGTANSEHNYFGFGINSNSLRYQAAGSGWHRFCQSTSVTASDTIVSIGNKSVGVNINTPTSNLQVVGSVSYPFRTTTTSTTVTSTDYTINCQNGAAAITIALPTPVGITGRIYIVKRDAGSTGAVTILPGAGQIQSISGAFGANTTLAALGIYGQSLMFQSDGTNWHRIN